MYTEIKTEPDRGQDSSTQQIGDQAREGNSKMPPKTRAEKTKSVSKKVPNPEGKSRQSGKGKAVRQPAKSASATLTKAKVSAIPTPTAPVMGAEKALTNTSSSMQTTSVVSTTIPTSNPLPRQAAIVPSGQVIVKSDSEEDKPAQPAMQKRKRLMVEVSDKKNDPALTQQVPPDAKRAKKIAQADTRDLVTYQKRASKESSVLPNRAMGEAKIPWDNDEELDLLVKIRERPDKPTWQATLVLVNQWRKEKKYERMRTLESIQTRYRQHTTKCCRRLRLPPWLPEELAKLQELFDTPKQDGSKRSWREVATELYDSLIEDLPVLRRTPKACKTKYSSLKRWKELEPDTTNATPVVKHPPGRGKGDYWTPDEDNLLIQMNNKVQGDKYRIAGHFLEAMWIKDPTYYRSPDAICAQLKRLRCGKKSKMNVQEFRYGPFTSQEKDQLLKIMQDPNTRTETQGLLQAKEALKRTWSVVRRAWSRIKPKTFRTRDWNNAEVILIDDDPSDNIRNNPPRRPELDEPTWDELEEEAEGLSSWRYRKRLVTRSRARSMIVAPEGTRMNPIIAFDDTDIDDVSSLAAAAGEDEVKSGDRVESGSDIEPKEEEEPTTIPVPASPALSVGATSDPNLDIEAASAVTEEASGLQTGEGDKKSDLSNAERCTVLTVRTPELQLAPGEIFPTLPFIGKLTKTQRSAVIHACYQRIKEIELERLQDVVQRKRWKWSPPLPNSQDDKQQRYRREYVKWRLLSPMIPGVIANTPETHEAAQELEQLGIDEDVEDDELLEQWEKLRVKPQVNEEQDTKAGGNEVAPADEMELYLSDLDDDQYELAWKRRQRAELLLRRVEASKRAEREALQPVVVATGEKIVQPRQWLGVENKKLNDQAIIGVVLVYTLAQEDSGLAMYSKFVRDRYGSCTELGCGVSWQGNTTKCMHAEYAQSGMIYKGAVSTEAEYHAMIGFANHREARAAYGMLTHATDKRYVEVDVQCITYGILQGYFDLGRIQQSMVRGALRNLPCWEVEVKLRRGTLSRDLMMLRHFMYGKLCDNSDHERGDVVLFCAGSLFMVLLTGNVEPKDVQCGWYITHANSMLSYARRAMANDDTTGDMISQFARRQFKVNGVSPLDINIRARYARTLVLGPANGIPFTFQQCEAVAMALQRSGVIHIHGTVACGKTTTVVVMAAAAVEIKGSKVLIATPNRDPAVETLRKMKMVSWFDMRVHGPIVYMGGMDQTPEDVRCYCFEAWIQRRREGMKKKTWPRTPTGGFVRVLDMAKIVVSTLSAAAAARVRVLKFTDVIIDEAGRVNEMELQCGLIPSARTLIVIGDPDQSPPFSALGHEIVKFSDASFEHHLNDDIISLTANAPNRTILTRQMRFNDHIGAVVQCFYPNNVILEHAIQARDQSAWFEGMDVTFGVTDHDESELAEQRVVLISCQGETVNDRQRVEQDQNQEYNVLERIQILRLLALVDATVSRRTDVPVPLHVAVISPYDKQCQLMTQELDWCCASWKGRMVVEAHTVDSIQGAEVDIGILTWVRNNAAARIGFLQDACFRPLVGSSRARRYLFWLIHRSTFKPEAGYSEMFAMAKTAPAKFKLVDVDFRYNELPCGKNQVIQFYDRIFNEYARTLDW